MVLTLVLGCVLAAGLLWAGLSNRPKFRSSSKQLLAAAGALVLVLIVAMTLEDLFGWWSKFPKELVGGVGILIVLERSVRLVRARSLGGSQLLNLGRIPIQDMIINLFAGAGLAWIGVSDLVVIVQLPHWAFRDLSLQILALSLSYAVLMQAISKRSLVEHGIFLGTGFVPWEQIESFSWEKKTATSSTLILHKRTTIPVLHFIALSIHAELTGAVEEILRKHSITRTDEGPKAVH